METTLMVKNRINKFFKLASPPTAGTRQATAIVPKRSQISSVRLCSKQIDLRQLRALVDLYDDENN